MLSTLQLYALLYAVAEAKTGFDEEARGEHGESGVLLLPAWLVHDTNTFTSKGFRLGDRVLDDVAFEIAVEYLRHYGALYEKMFNKEVKPPALVCILHYGWKRCLTASKAGKKVDVEGIWKKVEKETK